MLLVLIQLSFQAPVRRSLEDGERFRLSSGGVGSSLGGGFGQGFSGGFGSQENLHFGC